MCRFWNWIELFSPLSAILGLSLLESGNTTNAADLHAWSTIMMWIRLLQHSRSNESIGPLIPVILRMLREVLLFSAIMLILLLAFSFGMFSLLRPDIGVTVDSHGKVGINDQMIAGMRDASWPQDYRDLGPTIVTLARAALGDFNVDFSGARFQGTASVAYWIYLILMMLLLMNLLITVLVRVIAS